jgi:hypothetical protein
MGSGGGGALTCGYYNLSCARCWLQGAGDRWEGQRQVVVVVVVGYLIVTSIIYMYSNEEIGSNSMESTGNQSRILSPMGVHWSPLNFHQIPMDSSGVL